MSNKRNKGITNKIKNFTNGLNITKRVKNITNGAMNFTRKGYNYITEYTGLNRLTVTEFAELPFINLFFPRIQSNIYRDELAIFFYKETEALFEQYKSKKLNKGILLQKNLQRAFFYRLLLYNQLKLENEEHLFESNPNDISNILFFYFRITLIKRLTIADKLNINQVNHNFYYSKWDEIDKQIHRYYGWLKNDIKDMNRIVVFQGREYKLFDKYIFLIKYMELMKKTQNNIFELCDQLKKIHKYEIKTKNEFEDKKLVKDAQKYIHDFRERVNGNIVLEKEEINELIDNLTSEIKQRLKEKVFVYEVFRLLFTEIDSVQFPVVKKVKLQNSIEKKAIEIKEKRRKREIQKLRQIKELKSEVEFDLKENKEKEKETTLDNTLLEKIKKTKFFKSSFQKGLCVYKEDKITHYEDFYWFEPELIFNYNFLKHIITDDLNYVIDNDMVIINIDNLIVKNHIMYDSDKQIRMNEHIQVIITHKNNEPNTEEDVLDVIPPVTYTYFKPFKEFDDFEDGEILTVVSFVLPSMYNGTQFKINKRRREIYNDYIRIKNFNEMYFY